MQPHYIVAESSVRSQANIHDNYKTVFAKYDDVNIQTGHGFVDQHLPWYIGMAYPFTLPSAVGGYDVPQTPRWRWPEDDDLPADRSLMKDFWQPYRSLTSCYAEMGGRRVSHRLEEHLAVGPACKVKLFDLTRG